MLFAKVKGQNDAQITQYWAIPSYFNPSVVGNEDKIKVSAMDRMQWVGIDGAPKTFFAIAETPFRFIGLNNGVGALVISDEAGLFKTNSFLTQYALHLKLGKGVLSMGLRAGVIDYSFDGTKIDIPESGAHNPSDESIPKTSIGTMAFDAGVGVDYNYKGYYLSFSAVHLPAPELELDENSMLSINQLYYLSGGCNILFSNPLFELQPSFLVKSDFTVWQKDFTCRLTYNKLFYGGLSFRPKDSFSILAGVNIKGIRVGYSYDISTSSIAKASSGSHELYASYSFKLNFDKGTKNKHKSIRIL